MNSAKLRPMLAAPVNLNLGNIPFPMLASYKLDGIRAIVVEGKLLSRTLKPIANLYTYNRFSQRELNGLDGELIVGPPNSSTCFNTTTRAISSYEGTPSVIFCVFDNYLAKGGFTQRYQTLKDYSEITLVPQTKVFNYQQLEHLEGDALAQGYEGLILRHPEGPYKFGRSTLREGWMLKLKRFVDSEAVVVGTEEEMENLNPTTLDERGYTKRSSHQDNKLGKGRMGALIVRDLKTGSQFRIGSGFSDDEREEQWLPGMVVKYKYFSVGMKDLPRHPVFLGRRVNWDVPGE